jgi:hypothetical protein
MSEETNTNTEAPASDAAPEATPAPEAVAKETDPSTHTVPVSALQKEREKASAKISDLENRLAEIQAAEEERKRAELDEVERARLEAQEAKAQAEALQNQLVQEQRKQVALAAASTAGYRDPSDALRYVDLSGDLDAEEISEAVAKVLSEREYLKAEAPKGPAQTTSVGDGQNTETPADGSTAVASVLGDAMKILGR